MSETLLKSRPALDSVATGRSGAAIDPPGIVLTAMPEGHVLHVLLAPGVTDGAARVQAATAGFGSSVRAGPPGQLFAVGDRVLTASEFASVQAGLADVAAISDQAHGRVRIKAEGNSVRAMLAKGIAADLHPDAFPVGHASVMISGHVSTHLTRTGENSFELMVLRGFALDLWESLVHQSLEFGLECRKA